MPHLLAGKTALVLGVATYGLTLINVPGIVINIVLGLLLIAAIALPILIRRAAMMLGAARNSGVGSR